MAAFFATLKSALLVAPLTVFRVWINNSHYNKYGTMTEIRIDTKKRTAYVTLELRGEKEALNVKLVGYKLSSHGEKTILEIGKIETSREWLTLAIADFWKPADRKIEVPGVLKALL